MAISKEKWVEVQGYYEAGLSLAKIKDKTGVDRSTISKKAKIQQWQHGKNTDYIEARELIVAKKSTENQQLLNCADEVAEENIRYKNLIHNNATLLAGKLATMAEQIDEPQDLKYLVEANDKLAITLKVADRHAPKIDVTQQLGIRSDKETVINIIEDKAVNV